MLEARDVSANGGKRPFSQRKVPRSLGRAAGGRRRQRLAAYLAVVSSNLQMCVKQSSVAESTVGFMKSSTARRNDAS